LITQCNFTVCYEIISLSLFLSLIKSGAVESWAPEIRCLSLLMWRIGHTGGGKWSGRVGVRASAGNCGCKLSVHYSSIITAQVLSCLLYSMCDYYTDADVLPHPDTHEQTFCEKRQSSTTAAKLKSKVCVQLEMGHSWTIRSMRLSH